MPYIDFPYAIDDSGQTRRTDWANHARDLLIQYLLTAHGERVNRPDFGTALPRMCFEGNSHGIAEVIQFAARAGVQRWLGDAIQVLELSVTAQEATLAVDLSYRLRGEDEIRVARQTLALAPGAVL